MSLRDNGKLALKTIMKNENNINIFENNIYEASKDISNDSEDIENNYNNMIYQIINDVSCGKKLKDLINDVKNKNIIWKHKFFDNMNNNELEQDNFIENPFEVTEGAIECRCGSKKVFSIQKQTRGADEPMTTYSTCSVCKNSWVYSG